MSDGSHQQDFERDTGPAAAIAETCSLCAAQDSATRMFVDAWLADRADLSDRFFRVAAELEHGHD